MLTRTLMSVLSSTDSPRLVQATAKALEWSTGQRTLDLIQQKSGEYSFNPGTYNREEWYQRNGFYGIAGLSGGRSSHAGKSISNDSALENGALYACTKIFSEDIAGLPFFLNEQSSDGESIRKAYENSLYRVLHDAPNDDMSSGEFREALTAKIVLGIDGYAKIERARSTRQVAKLWPYDDSTQVRTEKNSYNQTFYVIKEGNSQEKEYGREEIFHIKGFTLDGKHGDDLLKRARHSIGLGLAADEYAGRFFAHDASPGLILTRPAGGQPIPPDQVKLIKAAWSQWHKGSARSHEPAILQDGMTASRLDPDHQKLQLIETRKNQVVEVARMCRMPLHKLAELDRSTNNNIEHQGIEYVSHGLGPYRRRWEEAVHRCLLTADERYHSNGRPKLRAEFNVEAMLRGDFRAQTEGWAKLLEKGVYSINDVRKWLGLNPVVGGDKQYVQMNMQDIASTATAVIADGGNQ